jgi:hypothetical protein
MRTRLTSAVVLSAALVTFGLAGCGGGSSNKTALTSPTATETAAPTTQPSPGTSFNFKNSKCAALAASAEALFGSLSPGSANGDNPFKDPKKFTDKLRAIANVAPSEIKGDINTIADAFDKFAKVVQSTGVDISDPSTYTNLSASDQQKLQQGAQQLQADAKPASDHINAFCGAR